MTGMLTVPAKLSLTATLMILSAIFWYIGTYNEVRGRHDYAWQGYVAKGLGYGGIAVMGIAALIQIWFYL
jgi:hypothetical protein